MNVGGILKEKGRQVETAGPDASLQDIASVLGEKKIGALIILKENGKKSRRNVQPGVQT